MVRRFLDDGDAVTVFGPSPEPCLSAADLARLDFVSGDVTDGTALDAAVRAARPDVVIGLAAHGGEGRGLLAAASEDEASALAVNVGGFHNLLQACLRVDVPRVLWASTLSVFADPSLYHGGTVRENSPRRPDTFYGVTKVLAEDLAGFYAYRMGLRATGLRLPLVFGPGLWYEGVAAQIGRLFEAAVRGEALSMEVPDAAVDMMYVKDAASAFLHLARHDGPLDYVYNVKAFAPTFAELADMVRKLTRDFPVDFTEVPAPHKYPTMSGDRLRAIGFHPAFSLREACADYLAELRVDME